MFTETFQIAGNLTFESLKELGKKLTLFCMENSLQQIVIATDGSWWAQNFAGSEDGLAYFLASQAIDVVYIEEPTIRSKFIWSLNTFDKSSNKIGIYITSNYYKQDLLNFTFYSPSLSLDKQTLISKEVKAFSFSSVETSPTLGKITEYVKNLKQGKFITQAVHKKPVHIDVMFGAGEYLIKELREHYKDFNIYNLHSSPTRLQNYINCPTGPSLAWWTKTLASSKKDYFFGLSPDGTRLGCYDLDQKTEIGSSSLFLIVLYYYHKILRKRGTIALTRAVGSSVQRYAQDLDMRVELVDTDDQTFINTVRKKRKSPLLLFGNSHGSFWFKNDTEDFNSILTLLKVIECCEKEDKSPGQLVDFIKDTFNLPEIQQRSMFIDSNVVSQYELVTELNLEGFKEGETWDLYDKSTHSRVVVTDNKVFNRLDLLLENENEELLAELLQNIERVIHTFDFN